MKKHIKLYMILISLAIIVITIGIIISRWISTPDDTINLPIATKERSYGYKISGPVSVVSGALPDGMQAGHEALPCPPIVTENCDANYYAIYGTPSKLGTYNFELNFSNDNTTQKYELRVVPPIFTGIAAYLRSLFLPKSPTIDFL